MYKLQQVTSLTSNENLIYQLLSLKTEFVFCLYSGKINVHVKFKEISRSFGEPYSIESSSSLLGSLFNSMGIEFSRMPPERLFDSNHIEFFRNSRRSV